MKSVKHQYCFHDTLSHMARMEALGSIPKRTKNRFSSPPSVWGVTRGEETFAKAETIDNEIVLANIPEKKFIEVRICDPENYTGTHNHIMKYPK